MNIRIYILVLLTILYSSAVTDAAETKEKPSGESALITLSLKGASLDELAKILESQSGVKFRIDRDIADKKVAMFVDEKPLSQVMNGLKTLFQYKWYLKESNGIPYYQFSMPDKMKNETEYGISYDELWSIFDKKLDEIIAEKDDLNSTDPSVYKKYLESTAAGFIKSFNPMMREAFLRGYQLWFNTESPEPQWIPPRNIIDGIINNTNPIGAGATLVQSELSSEQGRIEKTSIKAGISIDPRIKPVPNGLDITIMCPYNYTKSTINETTGNEGSMSGSSAIRLTPKDLILNIPYPSNYLPQSTENAVKDPITITMQEIADESGIKLKDNKTYANMADLLSILHKKTGMQVIADYYSVWNAAAGFNNAALSEIMKQAEKSFYPMHTGNDGKFHYFRNIYPVGYDNAETPNTVLAPLQEHSKSKSFFGLNQMADIYNLDDEKYNKLVQNKSFLKLSLGDEQSICLSNQSKLALKIFGMLSAKQRDTALDRGLGVALLSDAQKINLNINAKKIMDDVYPMGNMNSTSGIKAGVYKDGVRIDKPGHLPNLNITNIRVIEGIEADTMNLPLLSDPHVKIEYEGYTLILFDAEGNKLKIGIPIVTKFSMQVQQ